MVVAPALVIALLIAKRPLLEGLLSGILVAAGLGLAFGLIGVHQIIFIDVENFSAKGLIIDGMERGIGISIFTILLSGLVAGIEASGILDRIVDGTTSWIRSARGVEAWMFSTTSVAVLLTTHSVVALLTVGGYAKQIGERFGLGRYRRANILDLTVCIYPFIVPYCIPTVLASSTTSSGIAAGLAASRPPSDRPRQLSLVGIVAGDPVRHRDRLWALSGITESTRVNYFRIGVFLSENSGLIVMLPAPRLSSAFLSGLKYTTAPS